MTLPAAKILSVAVVLGVGLGCSLHQARDITPPGPLPQAFVETGAPDGTTPFVEQWWEHFDDPVLNELIDSALRNSPDIDIAFARLLQSRAVLGRTQAAELPFVSLSGEASRGETPGFSGRSEGSGYRLALAAGYELDLWNRLGSRTAAARLEAEASAATVKALYLGLAAQVADLYYLAVEQRAQLVLTQDTIRSFSSTLELVERRYREGLAPSLDVYQARQNLASATAQEPLRRSNLAKTEHALSVLLGHYPEHGITGELLRIPEAPELFPAGIPSGVLERRPDVEAAFLRVKAADARVAAAIADRLPSFSLLGSYGSSRTPFGADAISGTFWSLIFNLAQPLLDGGARKAESERSRAAFLELLRTYHKAVLTAVREVEDALAQNRATEERILAFTERARAAEASLRLSLDRYRSGLAEYLQVLSAQALDFDSQSRLIAERRQLISDRITLARALGGTWMTGALEDRERSGTEPRGTGP